MKRPRRPEGDVVADVPGRDEIVLVRTERAAWMFERWTTAGERLTRLDTECYFAGAEPAMLELPKKYRGEVTKVRVGDQSAPFSFFVRDRQAPAGVFLTLAELAGKLPPPEKRVLRRETPLEEVVRLARQSAKLAALAARNRRAPVSLLAELARHKSAAVRSEVAKADALTEELARKLARDKDPKVRLQVLLRHHTTPPDVVELLTRDPDPTVRRIAWREMPAQLGDGDLADQPLDARLAAVDWGIPIALERRLAADPSAKVRFKLADSRHPRKCGRSPSIDGKALALLAADKSAKVRAAAAHLTAYPKGTTKPPP